MKRSPIFSGTGLLALVLVVTSCSPVPSGTGVTPPVPELASGSLSSDVRVTTSADGIIQKAGISIYMEGTHQLMTDDGLTLLLESKAVDLDAYLDTRVRVIGTAKPTVEAGGHILDVVRVEALRERLAPEVLEETGAVVISSSEESSSVSSSSSVESSMSSVLSSRSSSVVTSRSSSVNLSSFASVSVVSSSVSSSDSSSTSSASLSPSSSSSISSSSIASSSPAAASASVTAMAKAKMDAGSFSQKYCTGHIGFCIPVHRNWFFKSFGANISPYLWHVEVSDVAIEEAGQGVIMVNLVSGALSASAAEGVAVSSGDFVVAQRQWTGNRHFEISAPAQLKAAVEVMANGVEVYQTE